MKKNKDKIKIVKDLGSLNLYKLIQENLGNSVGKDYPEFASAVKNGKKFWAAEYIIKGSNFEKELKGIINKGIFSKIKGVSIFLEGSDSMTLDNVGSVGERVINSLNLPKKCDIIWGAEFNNNKLKDKAILQLVLVS